MEAIVSFFNWFILILKLKCKCRNFQTCKKLFLHPDGIGNGYLFEAFWSISKLVFLSKNKIVFKYQDYLLSKNFYKEATPS